MKPIVMMMRIKIILKEELHKEHKPRMVILLVTRIPAPTKKVNKMTISGNKSKKLGAISKFMVIWV